MKILIILLLNLVLSFTPYTGLRFTVSKGKLEESQASYLSHINSKFLTMQWPNISEVISSTFDFEFHLMNIKSMDAKYEFGLHTGSSVRVVNKVIEIEEKGPVLTVTIGYVYNFMAFGIHLLFGTGTSKLITKTILIKEDFIHPNIKVTIEPQWEHSISINGFNAFGGIAKWIQKLFNEQAYSFLNPKLGSFFEELIKDWIKPWTDLNVSYYPDKNLMIVLKNDFKYVDLLQNNYISFGCKTDIAISNQPIYKALWKYINSDIVLASKTLEICMAKSVLIGVVDVYSKIDSLIKRLNFSDIGLSGKVSDLARIMPQIYTSFDIELDMFMNCYMGKNSDIVLLNSMGIQIPVTCSMGVVKFNVELLTVEFNVRGSVKAEHSESDDSFELWGTIENPFIYYERIVSAAYPVQDIDFVHNIISRIGGTLNKYTLVEPKIKVKTNLNLKTPKYKFSTEEECFEFD